MSGGKVAGALFALVFVVCFGSVGLFAGGAMGVALWEGIAAQDWIRVKARVIKYDSSGVQYQYRLNDKDYTGDKLGVGWLQSSSEVDDELDARLSAAKNEEKPITVFVNPDDPSKSLVDPQIPWTMMAFMTPFAFGFGGVGLGALYMMFRILSGTDDKKKKFAAGRQTIRSSAGSEVLGLWIFAFFWNVISFPIALIAVPDLWEKGEWLGLLVLIFPAIGVLMIWGAINGTIRMLRRGPANLVLASQEPRMGLPVSGYIAFPRGVKRGDSFRAKLSAHVKDGDSTVQAWSKDASVQAVEASDGPRVNFRFDVPSRLPTATVDPGDYEDLTWRLELYLPRATQQAAFSFPLELEPAPDLAEEGAPAREMTLEEMVPAGAAPVMAGIAAIVGKERMDQLSSKDRARFQAKLAELSPQQQEQVAKLVKAGPLIKKLIIAVVVLVVIVQVVGALIALGLTS